MRAVVQAIVLGAIILASPPVHRGPQPASASPLAEMPTLAAAGAGSLVFAVPPKAGMAPVLPDLPWPLPEARPDDLPDYLQGAVDPGSASVLSGSVARHDPNRRQVSAAIVNMRTGPSLQYPTSATLRRGDVAEVLGHARAGWVPVRLQANGLRGWVFQRHLAPLRGQVSPAQG